MSGDSWQRAVTYSKATGFIPLVVPNAVRALVSDHTTNNGQLRAATKYQISRFLRGENFRAMLYYVTKEVAEESLNGQKGLSIGDLVDLFKPLDLAAMIGSYVLLRRAKKTASAEEWNTIRPWFSRELKVGTQLGVAIPALGFGSGILFAAMPNIAHAYMSKGNPESYKTYRKGAAEANTLHAPALEEEIWGCTSAQVATIILASLGFGKEFSERFSSAMTTILPLPDIQEQVLRDLRLGYLWFECFALNREQPFEKLPAKFFPFPKDRDRAQTKILSIDVNLPVWVEKNKDDLSEALTPELFAPVDQNPEFEIPDQLKDVFSLKALTSMEEEEFDDLLDQIEEEQKKATKRTDVLSQAEIDEVNVLVS